jgi:hypothetical protein
MMHGINMLGADVSEAAYEKEVRPAGEVRVADSSTRTPASPSFDNLQVGDELPTQQARLSRGDLVNYAGVAGDANPLHWDVNIAKLAGQEDVLAHACSPWSGQQLRLGVVGRPGCGDPLRGPVVAARHRPGEGTEIEFTGKIKSLDRRPQRRGADRRQVGRPQDLGLATLNLRFS